MENENKTPETQPVKKHVIWKICKYFAIFLLLLIVTICGGFYWVTQTGSGQKWLLNTANGFLKPEQGKEGLQFILTSLSGSLPFNFHFGLEAHDAAGLWLSAPDNSFNLNWRQLPGKIHIQELKIANADLSRLPMLPDEKKEEVPEKPFTIKDFQDLLQSVGNFLYEKHWWLPDLVIEGTGLENFILPANLLQEIKNDQQRPVLTSLFNLNFINQEANLNGSIRLAPAGELPLKLPSLTLKTAQIDLAASIKPDAAAQKLDTKTTVYINVDNPELALPDFPSNLLGQNIDLNINIEGMAVTNPQKPSLSLSIQGPELKAGSIAMEGGLAWESGAGWANTELDGSQKTRLNIEYNPPDSSWLNENPSSPLAMLPNPVKLAFRANGELPDTDMVLDLATNGITVAKKDITDIHLLLKGLNLVIPLNENAIGKLLDEHHLNLDLEAIAENIPVKFQTMLFFKGMGSHASGISAMDEIKEWLVGLRQLSVEAGGIQGKGDVACGLIPSHNPVINGKFAFNVENWNTINKFLPDMSLAGKLDLHLDLASATPGSTVPNHGTGLRLPEKAEGRQNATVQLSIPDLTITMGQDNYSIANLKSAIKVEDIFGKMNFDTSLEAGSIRGLGMGMAANMKVSGQLDGPINASLRSSGSINSKLDAIWSPGEANVRNLDIEMNLPPALSPSGKSGRLAIHSRQPIHLAYGPKGINVQGLNIDITPSGNLKAHARLAQDQLDCKIQLDNLNFKPWQALVKQLPTGSANLSATLNGTPKKPSGNFQLNVNKVVIPGAALPPVSLAMKGSIENRGAASALRLALNLDPATLKTLGGTVGNLSASLPLVFGTDGMPKPDMNGSLSAKVRWDGALGPLWNLVPIADMRLNGRVNINIDADGKLNAPKVRGGVAVSHARFEEVALGVLLTDINMKVNLTDHIPGEKAAAGNSAFKLPGGAELNFSASDGRGGTIKIGGHAGLMGNDLNITTKIDHLKPLRRRDIHIELSGDASVKGKASAPIIVGEIIVNQGEVLLNNLEITGSVTTLPITEPGSKPRESKISASTTPGKPKGQGSLNVRVRMLPRFTVEGRGLTSIWQANLLIQGTPEDPRITGEINSVKGNFDFLGKNFALTKGVVFFGGGLVSNPLLDIDLTNETPDLTAHLLITGPVSKIKLSMTSDPSLPRDEILSRVLFGRSVGDLSRMEALQLAGAVAQLAGFGGGSGILGMAKKALGVDVLRLGTTSSNAAGEPGDQTAGGTTIEMGKYITDMIYMGVQQGMQPDSTAFIIQLELTPRTNLEIRTEQNNTWGGLQWKYNY